MIVIFVSLFFTGIIKTLTSIIFYILGGMFLNSVCQLKKFLNVKYTKEHWLSNFYYKFFIVINWFVSYSLLGLFLFTYSVEGTPDDSAPIKIGIHKDFNEGFHMMMCLNISPIYDIKGISKIPLLQSVMDGFEGIKLDRTNAESRKNAALTPMLYAWEYFKNGYCNPLIIFPEGSMSNQEYMKEFQPGAFNLLRGVQLIKFTYEPDLLTGIHSSNSRSYLVWWLLNIAKVYSVYVNEYLDTFEYKDYRIEIEKFNSLNELKKYIEENKEVIKEHSAKMAYSTQDFIQKKYGYKLQENYKYFDGFDAINYRNWMIENFDEYSQKETDYSIQGVKGDKLYEKVNKEMFVYWIKNCRAQTLTKIKDQPKLYRSNQELIESIVY